MARRRQVRRPPSPPPFVHSSPTLDKLREFGVALKREEMKAKWMAIAKKARAKAKGEHQRKKRSRWHRVTRAQWVAARDKVELIAEEIQDMPVVTVVSKEDVKDLDKLHERWGFFGRAKILRQRNAEPRDFWAVYLIARMSDFDCFEEFVD